jgi:hypothetical protein
VERFDCSHRTVDGSGSGFRVLPQKAPEAIRQPNTHEPTPRIPLRRAALTLRGCTIGKMLRLGEAMLRLGNGETVDFIGLLRCYA